MSHSEPPTTSVSDAISAGRVDHHYDVIVVGYGPVGRLLALQLGQRGHSVGVIERKGQVYPLPRAVHFDDEIGRIMQNCGMAPESMTSAVTPYDDFYEWRNAKRETLLRLDWRGTGPSGWHVSHFFHQPTLEESLNTQVEALESVTIWRGWEAISHENTQSTVNVEVRSSDDARMVLSGRYVVGADGANSRVRDWVGSSMTDLGYFHDWLVVDLIPTRPMPVDPPAWQLCDPTRPTTIVPGGPGRRRFEFMRLEHETREQMNTEDCAWELLTPWGVDQSNAAMERHTVYTFQARWCDQWRNDRILLAGDSAHLMPPFAGQGMCSGLRDVVNLEWKLHLVLAGLAPDRLLDSYGPERAEHVRHFIDASMQLGSVICITDAEAAAERDRRMIADHLAGVGMPPRPLPRLGDGGMHRNDAAGGTLSIQARVRRDGNEGLFDDLFDGPGVLLVSGSARAGVTKAHQESLARIGFAIVSVGAADESVDAVDIDGAYTAWFTELDAQAIMIRPDFYVYGVATDSYPIDSLVTDFLADATSPALTAGIPA